ncbi:MAG: hypothetical protein JNK56_15770 [Myxococcales bacterium]|nr:hypothetical protein [Myxococcales bacterium]
MSPERPLAESPTSIDILFAPVLQVVSTMRRFVLALYEGVLEDPEASAEMALVTHELLENAVKYNTHDSARLRVSVVSQNDPPGHVVTIRAANRASLAHIHGAERLVSRVRGAIDPDLMYQEMIISSLEQNEGSGLGLARIRAETQMSLDTRVIGDEIEVIARALVPYGGAA